jgi:hypothetical protein
MPQPPASFTAFIQSPIVDAKGQPSRAFLKVLQQWGAQLQNLPGGVITFTDITGQLDITQLPDSGISHTIPLAALTIGGTPGSITYTNGLATAFVLPT